MRAVVAVASFVSLLAVLGSSAQNLPMAQRKPLADGSRAFASDGLSVRRNAGAKFGAANRQAAPIAPQPGIFFEAPQYSAVPINDAEPFGMAMGDFNGDGRMDLAVISDNPSWVNVLLGNSDGSFQAPLTYPVGSQPMSIAVGDFNGDGKLDLVVGAGPKDGLSFGASVVVFLGNGDGTFQPPVDYPLATGPQSVAVGDFNGDGKLDLAVTSGDGVSVSLGNGDGTFQPFIDYATGVGGGSEPVAVGDFNGDGKADLVVVNGKGGGVSVLLGNGDGTFKTPVESPWGLGFDIYPVPLVAADLNGDGRLDLVALNGCGPPPLCAAGTVAVLLGKGDGTFQSPTDYPVYGSSITGWLAAGDLNGDGHPDLAVALNGIVNVLFGNGDGTFQPRVAYTEGGETGLDVGFLLTGLEMWDFNDDGSSDLAVLGGYGAFGFGTVAVLLGNGDGSFQASRIYPAATGSDSVAVADFNGDGKPDLVAAGGGSVSVFLGNGDGTFQPYVNYGAGVGGDSVAVGDFNGDGKLDLATAGGGSVDLGSVGGGSVSVFLGNGDGTFQPYVAYATGADGGSQSIAVGDLNGDGKPDLVVANGIKFDWLGSSVSVLLGNGDGTFQSSRYAGGLSSSPSGVAVGDFNGDGKLDLAVAHSCRLNVLEPGDTNIFCEGTGSVGVLMGNGDGTFGVEVGYNVGGNYPESVAIGDFNLDGKLDLALADNAAVDVLLGNGDGTFQASKAYPSGASPEPGADSFPFPQSVVVGDFNGDGKPDLAVSNSGGAVVVLIGNGDGSFLAPQDYPAGYGSHSLAVGDFNGDGALDLVTEGVAVLLNRQGTFVNIQSSSNPSIVGQIIKFTVTVAASMRGTASPTGTVTVSDGATVVGSAALVSGQFSVSTSSLTAGAHNISATYSGDSNFQKHTSALLKQTLNGPDFSVSKIVPEPNPLPAGQSATASVTVGSLFQFGSSVALTCSVSPTPSMAPSCSLNPTSVTPAANGSATSTLTIKTTGPVAGVMRPALQRDLRPLYVIWLPIAGLLWFGIAPSSNRSRRRKFFGLLAGLALSFGLLFHVGCGEGSSSGSSGTPAGNYTVTVTAKSGSLTHKAVVMLAVQ